MKNYRNEKGITCIEVICCIFLMAMFISPICLGYINTAKVHSSARSIDIATTKTEQLMEQIKESLINEDIQVIEHKPNQIIPLNQLITNLNDYETETYRYEVAIWNMTQRENWENELFLNVTTLSSAIKFCSEVEIESIFDEFIPDNQLLSFSLPRKEEKSEAERIGQYYITLKAEEGGKIKFESKEKVKQRLKIESSEIKVGGKIVGYTCTISSTEHLKHGMIVEIDMSDLMKVADKNTALYELYQDYIIQIRNKLNTDLMVQVICASRANENQEEEMQQQFYEKFKNYMEIIGEQKGDTRTTIERLKNKQRNNEFLIVVIVREKKPVIGQEGRIIKQMVDSCSISVT